MDKKYLLSYTVDLCRQCHSAIHRLRSRRHVTLYRIDVASDHCASCGLHRTYSLYDEETLGRDYRTLDALLADEKVLKFIKYIRKQRVRTKVDSMNPKIRYSK